MCGQEWKRYEMRGISIVPRIKLSVWNKVSGNALDVALHLVVYIDVQAQFK